MNIPERFRVHCEFCDQLLDARRPGVYAHTSGWVKNRSQGGGNAVTLSERTGRYACKTCIEVAQAKGQGLQPALF